MSDAAPMHRGPLSLVRVLLVVAMSMAGYLAWASLSSGPIAGCGPASECDKVLKSRWAYWLGVPVSIPAFVAYLGLLAATFQITPSKAPMRQRNAWMAIISLSVLVLGAAVWFVALQVFALKSFCPFCMTAHGSGFLASVVLLNSIPLPVMDVWRKRAVERIEIPGRVAANVGLVGLAGVLVLLSGQLLVEKKRFLVKTIPEAGSAQPVEAVPAEPASPPPRHLLIHNGQFRLDLRELPLIGSPDAPYAMVSLFDYTCHYCRDLHEVLLEAQRKFSSRLAIVTLPVPLESNCNHMISRTSGPHVNACQYARLSLAVWRAKRDAFGQFDSWLFKPDYPPPVEEVKQYAEKLVGAQVLERALADEWIERQIQNDIAIYGANISRMGNGAMPQLIVGTAISLGPLRSLDLYRLLAEQFGLEGGPETTP